MRLQSRISTPHKKSQALVSESAPAPHCAQPDPLQAQDSPIDSEDGSGPESPPAEHTLATIMHAIQDCKAPLTAQIASVHMDFSLLKQDVQNLRDRAGEAEEHISSLENGGNGIQKSFEEEQPPLRWFP